MMQVSFMLVSKMQEASLQKKKRMGFMQGHKLSDSLREAHWIQCMSVVRSERRGLGDLRGQLCSSAHDSNRCHHGR